MCQRHTRTPRVQGALMSASPVAVARWAWIQLARQLCTTAGAMLFVPVAAAYATTVPDLVVFGSLLLLPAAGCAGFGGVLQAGAPAQPLPLAAGEQRHAIRTSAAPVDRRSRPLPPRASVMEPTAHELEGASAAGAFVPAGPAAVSDRTVELAAVQTRPPQAFPPGTSRSYSTNGARAPIDSESALLRTLIV
jgi:hypothetical protein